MFRLVIISVLLLWTNLAHASELSLQYEPHKIVLSGTLFFEKHYGPPNFGESPETDKVVYDPMLKLDAPVTVVGNSEGAENSTSFHGIEIIQIADLKTDLHIYDQQHVRVYGSLSQQILAWQKTDVVLYAKKVELIK